MAAITGELAVAAAPVAYGAMAQYPASEKLKKQFTIMSRFGDVVQMYSESNDGTMMFVPRACCPVGDNDKRIDGYPVSFTSKFVPRNPEQARVVPEIIALLKKGESFIFDAPTGFGKTVVFSAVAAAIGVTTLVVCTKDDLVKQARTRFLQHTDLKPEEIGLIQQDTCDVFGKKVVIASLQSLAIPGRYPATIRSYFGLVIFDEVHRLGAETFSYVAGLFPAKLRLGVSATVNRIDGKEVVFQAHIGPVRVKAKGIPMVPKVLRYQTKWMVPRWNVNGQMQKLPHTPGKCGHVLKYLSKDVGRNKLILHLIERAYVNKRRHVVFSHLTEHLEMLELASRKLGVDPADIGRYYGAMSAKKLEIAGTKRLIFATPQKMGEGTDLPWLDCCTLGTPLANVEQIAGRVLREYEGKSQPIIFDLLDDDSPVFLGYAKKRSRYYAKLGAEVKHMAV